MTQKNGTKAGAGSGSSSRRRTSNSDSSSEIDLVKEGIVDRLTHTRDIFIVYGEIVVRICPLSKHVFFPTCYVSRFWRGNVSKVKFQMIQDGVDNFFIGLVREPESIFCGADRFEYRHIFRNHIIVPQNELVFFISCKYHGNIVPKYLVKF